MLLIKNESGNYDVYVDPKQLTKLKLQLRLIMANGGKYIYNCNE